MAIWKVHSWKLCSLDWKHLQTLWIRFERPHFAWLDDHMLSHLPMQHFKRYHNSTKKTQNLTVWFHASTWSLWNKASVSKVILIDWIGSQRRLFGVFGRVWSQILPEKHRSHVLGDPLSTGWHDSLKKGNFQFLLFTKVKLQGNKNDI